MFAPSLRRWPVAPVELARSDPARSTKLVDGIQLISGASERSTRGYRGGELAACVHGAHLIRDTFSVSKFVFSSRLFMVRRSVNTA